MSLDKIAALKAERASLAGKLGDVTAARERLRSAQGQEATVLAEIGRLGASEVKALSAWARTGEGPKPAPDAAARATLHDRLVQSQLGAEQAQAASAGLDVDERDLTAELQRVNAAIDNAALDRLSERHAAEVANLQAFVREHVAPKIARAFGLHAWLAEVGQRHIASGRTDSGTAYLRRAEAIGLAMPGLDAEPTPGEVIDKMALWSSRFAELTSDSPAGNVVAIGGAAA